MKNVLIPTDFSFASLELVSAVAKAIPHKINIVLFHAFEMPDNLRDAMRMAGLSDHSHLMTEALRIKCKKIKGANSNINNINFRIMYGTTVIAFENYADANDIDMIVWPEGYVFTPVSPNSVDPTRMFAKSGITLMRKTESKKSVTAVKPNLSQNDTSVLQGSAMAH